MSPSAPLKVLFIASEVTPFRKTGGLADVAGALPKALRRRGIDIRVVMPLYSGMSWTNLERLDGSVDGSHVRRSVASRGAPGSLTGQRRAGVLPGIQPLL